MTTATKIEYFNGLKTQMNGKIKIEDESHIYRLVENILDPFFIKNELKSANAGYEIQENADGDQLSFLGDRVEVNLATGETFNAWIEKDDSVVDLSNAQGVKTAKNQVFAALQNNNLPDSDYALVKIAAKMIYLLADYDETGDLLAAKGKLPFYNETAYTSENFLTITAENLPELMTAKTLMMLAKVREDDYRTDWGKGLIRAFSFNRNAVAKAVICALKIAGINASGKTDYAMVEKIEDVFTVTTQCGEIYDLPGGDYALHGNKIFDLLNHELASFDNAADAQKAAEELDKAIERGDKTFTFAVEKNPLKAKVAEILNRPRKPIIDWNAVNLDLQLAELRHFQRVFKQNLRLGRLELADNIFTLLKTLCKNFRANNAA